MTPESPTTYTILIQGALGAEWSEWFDGMQLRCDGHGNTLLTGAVRDLGLTLLAVARND